MLPRQMVQQVRRLHLWARRAVEDWLGGAYHSVFKGAGIAFEEVREYQPGDDVRSIDWHVTARMGVPFVKRFIEERELTVVLAVDVSPSMDFGSGAVTKRQVAVETAALLALGALYNNDKVGLVLFGSGVEKVIPPRKGSRHALRLLRDILVRQSAGPPAERTAPVGLAGMLTTLNRILHRRAVVVLISDFQDHGFERMLKRTAVRHDLIGVFPQDPWEQELPAVGWLHVRDPETGGVRLLDTFDADFRRDYAARARQRADALRRLAQSAEVDWIEVGTHGNHLDALHAFFELRRRRFGQGR